jgi:hypothetical protein
MLKVDWKKRISLRELRHEIDNIDTFYSEDVIFDGSMARCAWEAGMDIESESSTKGGSLEGLGREDLKSCWSKDSESEMVFASPSTIESSNWMEYSPSSANWGHSPVQSSDVYTIYASDSPPTPRSTRSSLSPSSSPGYECLPSPPTTPNSVDMQFAFGGNLAEFDKIPTKRLTIDTDCYRDEYYNNGDNRMSVVSSIMQTALDSYDADASSLYLPSATPSSRVLRNSVVMEDGELEDMSSWRSSFPSVYTTTDDERCETSSEGSIWPEPVTRPRALSSMFYTMSNSSGPRTPPSPKPVPKKATEGKHRGSAFFRFAFPRLPQPPAAPLAGESELSDSFSSLTFGRPRTPSTSGPTWSSQKSSIILSPQDASCRKEARIRSPRYWFSPAKLFAS